MRLNGEEMQTLIEAIDSWINEPLVVGMLRGAMLSAMSKDSPDDQIREDAIKENDRRDKVGTVLKAKLIEAKTKAEQKAQTKSAIEDLTR